MSATLSTPNLAGRPVASQGPFLSAPGSTPARTPLVLQPPGPHPAALARLSPEAAALADAEMQQKYPGSLPLRPSPYLPGQEERSREWSESFARNRERLRQQQAGGVPPGETCVACQAAQNLCQIEKVTIKCGHSARTFVAVVGVGANTQELQVVAGHTVTDKVKLETVVKKPLCGTREHQAKHFRVTHNGQTRTYPGSSAEFTVSHPLRITRAGVVPSPLALWRSLRPLQEEPAKYKAEALACKGAATTYLTVSVYPEVEWEIKYGLKISVGAQINAGSSGAGASRHSATQTDGISLYLEAKCVYDNKSHELGVELKGEWEKKQPWVQAVMKMAKWLRKLFYLVANINVVFPEIDLQGTYKSKVEEKPDDWKVYNNTEWTFGGAPILGGRLEFELIDVILRAAGSALAAVGIVVAPGVAQFLIKLRQRLSEGVGSSRFGARGTVSVKLSIGGGIHCGGITVKNKWGRQTAEAGLVSGKIEFKAKGEVSGEATALIIKASAGGTVEGKASVEAGFWAGKFVEKGREVDGVRGGVRFGGMKIEIAGWITVKVEWRIFGSSQKTEYYRKEIELIPQGQWHTTLIPALSK